MASAVSLQGLTKFFGGRRAVDSVSLEIAQGELFGFLGPNGAGKTTTIKMVVGLLQPSSGTALVYGHDVVTNPLEAKAVTGYVPDHTQLYEKLTGRETLRLVADLYRVPRQMQAPRMEPLLETFELVDAADDLVQSYSRGMRQKLALCAALIHDPKVLFLDEPTVGLDPASARQMQEVLRRLCADGTTIFLSTHVLAVAETLCDRVGILQHGRLLTVDSTSALRNAQDRDLEDAFLRLTGRDDTDLSALPSKLGA